MKIHLRKTIFTRLLVTFILVLIPIYVIGTGIYTNGMVVVKNEILDSIKNQALFKMNTLESNILLIRNSIDEYTQDEDLYKIANYPNSLNDYERTEYIIRIQRRFKEIKTNSIFISDIGIFIPSIGKVIHTLGKIDTIDNELLDTLKKEHSIFINGLIFIDNRLFLVSEYPFISGASGKNPMFLIYVELSVDLLNNYMSEFSGNNNIFILGNNNLQDVISNIADNDDIVTTLKTMHERSKGQLQQVSEFQVQKKNYLLIYNFSENFNFQMYTVIPVNSLYEPLFKYKVWFWIFSLISVFVILIYSFSTYKFIQKPIIKLINSFKALEKGNMDVQINYTSHSEFDYLFKQFNKTVFKLDELIDQVYKQKILMQSAKLKDLQSQINPHFLYNTFFLLNSMVKEKDLQNIEEFTVHLGNYFKYITRNKNDEIPLIDEASHANAYIEIQQKRFGNRIEAFMQELPKNYYNIRVPRLILQPIIENVYEHGLKDKLSGGIMKVSYEENEKMLCIIIEDNGNKLSDDSLSTLSNEIQSSVQGSEITGIINIHKRLILRFGDKGGITVTRSSMGGLKVSMGIPKEGNNGCIE